MISVEFPLFFFYLVSAVKYDRRISTSSEVNSISFSMNPEYPDCSMIEFVYQLYKESNGQLVRDGVTTDLSFTITDLECGTSYRLHITNDKTELDFWTLITTRYENPCKKGLLNSTFLSFDSFFFKFVLIFQY